MNNEDRKMQQSLDQKVTMLTADMEWVKKILGNHLQHHDRLAIGLIVVTIGAIASLITTLIVT